MGGAAPKNFKLHLWQGHIPFSIQPIAILTKMWLQLAPWVVRTTMATTNTELATLAYLPATMRAWHDSTLGRQLTLKWLRSS